MTEEDVRAGWSSVMAALGFALLMPFHRLSRFALSCGDSAYLDLLSDSPLLLLPYEKPLDLGGRDAETGVVGPWSMFVV